MTKWQSKLISKLMLATIAACFIQSATHAEFFPGNIFELRPPRVRTATVLESADTPENRQYFAFQEPPPQSTPQESIHLSDADLLSAVFPVGGGSFSSGEVAYVVAGLGIDEFNITLDYHSFPTFFREMRLSHLGSKVCLSGLCQLANTHSTYADGS